MIEVSFFGWLLGTLASGVSIVLIVIALAALTFLGGTLLSAAARPRASASLTPKRIGALFGAPTLVLLLLGLRVGTAGQGADLVATLLVSASAAIATGVSAACLWVTTARGLSGLASAGAGRAARARLARRRAEEDARDRARALLDGKDLAAQVDQAAASLERLRAALDTLAKGRAELDARIEANGDAELPADLAAAREDLTAKSELGGRVLAAAEAAVFRLRCGEPLRRLLRKRPRDATMALLARTTMPDGDAPFPPMLAMQAFLLEVRAAKGSLDELSAYRPALVGDDDPLDRARREIDAMEEAYAAVIDRADVVRVRLAAREGMEEVATAAEDLSAQAAAMGLDEGELHQLVKEVARAEAAMTLATPDETDANAITLALGEVALALARDDDASLEDLVRSLRDLG